MNPIVTRLAVSFASAVVVFFALQTIPELSGNQADIATFAIIFFGTAAALFLNPGSNRGSNKRSSTPSSGQETGTVKWFNVKKGYGFITRDSGDDVFVHYRNINSSGKANGRRGISDGQRVKFVVVDGDKGLQADDVEAI